MNPLIIIGLVVGWLVGFFPMYSWHSYQNVQREKAIADAKLIQEKKNVEIITSYTDAIGVISDYYRKHPVRVLLPGSGKECPGSTDTSAKDVIFTVGGIKSGDRSTTD